jgi:hypothetical protein
MRKRSGAQYALLTLACLVLATPASAKRSSKVADGDAVSALFQQYVDALKGGDWDATARMMHPDALAEMHEVFVALAELDGTGEVAEEFFGVQTLAEVQAHTPEQTFAAIMRNLIGGDPQVAAAFGGSDVQMIGTVAEGDTLHLVYRMGLSLQGAPVTKLAVASFQRHDGEWRMLLSGEIDGLVQMLRMQAGI